MDFYVLQGAIKCNLCPASDKNFLYLILKIIFYQTNSKLFLKLIDIALFIVRYTKNL